MEQYVFVCIGTNKLISDSFGPRVGEKLKSTFEEMPNVMVFGTMQEPIHFNNAEKILETLKKLENTNKIILIDSAISKKQEIGSTYIKKGGIELGKAYGKSLYFPAYLSIKTVVANKVMAQNLNKIQIDLLAQKIANRIVQAVYEL